MPIKRRGSKNAIQNYSWTSLFHRIATGVLQEVIPGNFSSETITREKPEITKSAVEDVEKNTTNKESATTAVISQTISVEDNKANNEEMNKEKYNKKDDVAELIANTDDLYVYESESEGSVPCQTDADHLEETATENGSPFVLLDLEPKYLMTFDMLHPTNIVIKGLPSHVTEDKVLLELAQYSFCPIDIHKIALEESSQVTDPLFLVKVPTFIESRILKMDKLLSYEVNVQKQGPEHKASECTKCNGFGHDNTNCDILTNEGTKQIGKNNFSGSNGTADLGDTSVISETSSASISKAVILSSSRNSILNSPSSKADNSKSSDTVPKEIYIRDTTQLLEELTTIREELETIRLELKINLAKKVDSDVIRVILQGIPSEVKSAHIISDLKSKLFSLDTVYSRNEQSEDVFVELPKKQDHILDLSCCLGFEVLVEEYKGNFSSLKIRLDISLGQYTIWNEPFNVIFRGIPIDVPESDILKDLKGKHFHPIAIYGMVPPVRSLQENLNNGFLVQVPPEEDQIIELTCVLGFVITVDSVEKGNLNVSQCKTCLQFGHSTMMCSGNKTSEKDNISAERCKIPDDEPTINAVVRGIPIEFNDGLVLKDLTKKGFNPIAIHRMIVNEEILDSYLIQVPERETRIFRLTCCLGFNVMVDNFLPDLYHVEQCEKCRQFGYCGNDRNGQTNIQSSSRTVKKEVVEKNVYKKDVDSLCDNVDSRDRQIEFSVSNSPSFKSSSTQTECLDEKLSHQFNSLEAALKTFIRENNKEIYKFCCCRKMSINDKSTNTESTYAQLEEMDQAIKFSQVEFLKLLELFIQTFAPETNITFGKIGDSIKSYVKLKEMSSITTSFVEAMIRILKSTTYLMISIPNLPGQTSNTVNEQLHLLEELEDLKKNMDSTPGKFTRKYHGNFPKLK